MIKVAICDDEPVIASQIEQLLLTLAQSHAVSLDIDCFMDGISLELAIRDGIQYDLLYLDIQMKMQDGITAAHNIRKLDTNVLIIYVTGHSKYVEEVFAVDTFDFIKKPINEIHFEKCFIRALERISAQAAYFECHFKNEWLKFAYGEILYFESHGRKIYIHTVSGTVEIFNGKLDIVEQEIQNSKIPFLRIHKSYLVNYYYIRAFSRNRIRLNNGFLLPVSPKRYEQVREVFGKLLGGEISD